MGLVSQPVFVNNMQEGKWKDKICKENGLGLTCELHNVCTL